MTISQALPQVHQQIARRKKKPHRPGVDPVPEHVRLQLGLPTVERQQHSNFHEDQLAPGAPNGGVKRARVKYLFTDIDQREALVEFAVQDLKARGIFDGGTDGINVDQTSMDRNFTSGEFEAICWFARVHAEVEGGHGGGTVDYGGVSGGGNPGNRLPLSKAEFEDRGGYAFVLERLPESFVMFLDWVSHCQYPECFTDTSIPMPGKIRMGKAMFDAKDEKYLRGGVDGFFKAVCQVIAHWRGERETMLRRRRLVREEYAHPRKKLRQTEEKA